MADPEQTATHPARQMVARGLSLVEDVVYVGLGVLLAISALALLLASLNTFISSILAHALADRFVGELDQVLLILLVVELLYTVQVSFREHRLTAEPFLVVAVIAVIRRILVLTAETAHLPDATPAVFQRSIIELAMLTAMVLALVASLIALQRNTK